MKDFNEKFFCKNGFLSLLGWKFLGSGGCFIFSNFIFFWSRSKLCVRDCFRSVQISLIQHERSQVVLGQCCVVTAVWYWNKLAAKVMLIGWKVDRIWSSVLDLHNCVACGFWVGALSTLNNFVWCLGYAGVQSVLKMLSEIMVSF